MTTLADQLRAEEGERASAYQDSLGYWTIGVGRLIDARKGGRLRSNEIDFMLTNDIEEKTGEMLEPEKAGDFLPVQAFLRKPLDAAVLKQKVAELI